MHHSTWDLEVHAKEMQRRRFREAERARQFQVARHHSRQRHVTASRFSFSRLMTAVRNYLSPQPIPVTGAGSPALVEARLRPLAAKESQVIPKGMAGELSQPYAGMVVLARGSSAQNAAQPCVAGDC